MVETNNPEAELKPAFDIIGDVLETFITITDLYEPIDTSFKDNVIYNLLTTLQVFITKSFDALSHFEKDIENVFEVYKKITGKDLNLEMPEEGAQQG